MKHILLLAMLLPALSDAIDVADQKNPPAGRPNILFMLTDDQRWDAIGLGGSRYLQTPNMDRLGKEGVYFRNAFCTTSLCSPMAEVGLAPQSNKMPLDEGIKDQLPDAKIR